MHDELQKKDSYLAALTFGRAMRGQRARPGNSMACRPVREDSTKRCQRRIPDPRLCRRVRGGDGGGLALIGACIRTPPHGVRNS